MLLYTLIVSPGYYVQNRGTPFVLMFARMFVLAAISLILQVRPRKPAGSLQGAVP